MSIVTVSWYYVQLVTMNAAAANRHMCCAIGFDYGPELVKLPQQDTTGWRDHLRDSSAHCPDTWRFVLHLLITCLLRCCPREGLAGAQLQGYKQRVLLLLCNGPLRRMQYLLCLLLLCQHFCSQDDAIQVLLYWQIWFAAF